MIQFRHQLHQNPEPAFEEQATSDALANYLGTIPGMHIQRGVAKTGIVATLCPEKNGPCVALRADMDCLRMEEASGVSYTSRSKGLMHACGHDGHCASLLGAALVLGRLQEELVGPVKFLFQPAEENYGGGSVMVEEGALHDPEVKAIFALHGTPAIERGSVGVRSGSVMAASRYFKIVIRGEGGHAAMPHLGVDPVLIGSQIICGVQSIISRNTNPLEAGLISIPKFTGSTAPNVIPDRVVLEGTLRALSTPTRELLQSRLAEMVGNIAKAHGGSAEIVFDKGYPLLENDPDSVKYFIGIAEETIGAERVNAAYPPSLGAEDFAYYLQKVPGVFWWLGLREKGDEQVSLHNPRFDFNDRAIPTAIEMHCRLVLNYQ